MSDDTQDISEPGAWIAMELPIQISTHEGRLVVLADLNVIRANDHGRLVKAYLSAIATAGELGAEAEPIKHVLALATGLALAAAIYDIGKPNDKPAVM